jgi:hypothetical protein
MEGHIVSFRFGYKIFQLLQYFCSPVIVPTRPLKEDSRAEAQEEDFLREAEAVENVTAAEKLGISRATAPSLGVTAAAAEEDMVVLSAEEEEEEEARKLGMFEFKIFADVRAGTHRLTVPQQLYLRRCRPLVS